MYKYIKDLPPIVLDELDIRKLIGSNEPMVKLEFSLDTSWLKRDFNLDLIIWNLSENNLDRMQRIVRYILDNFNRLFETGRTALYHYLCKIAPNIAKHTLQDFFTEQIDFDSPYYTIQLEINCNHQNDVQARYCFVVSTVCSYKKWMISDDNMRVYMNGNMDCGFNTNNDDGQMREDLENCEIFYGMEKTLTKYYEQMEQNGFQFAESFET